METKIDISQLFQTAPSEFGGTNGRAAYGEEFSKEIFEDLQRWGFSVAMNGTEHTHSDFVKLLKTSRDKTSLMIRYAPDGVIAIGKVPRSAYVEAKRSKYIERDAYENYLRLANDGAIVFVVFSVGGNKLFDLAQNIQFLPPHELNDWPLDDDGWMCPRLHPNFLEKKRNGFNGSGTPYKAVAWENLHKWDNFKSHAIAEMTNLGINP